jgi:positive regulator of sigma E activity
MLIGAVLADSFLKNEFLVILSAALGLVLGFLWVKRYLTRKNGQYLNTQAYAIILRHAEDVVSDNNNVQITKTTVFNVDVKKS